MTEPFDSRPDTLAHSRRVGELIHEVVKELLDRAVNHDLSKTEGIEREAFDRMTPRLRTLTYGTDAYRASLAELGPALQHHYRVNRHHPEHFGDLGVRGMTLIDVVEMLADWRAATERHDDGDLGKSLLHNRARFELGDVLYEILLNTADHLRWLSIRRLPA